MRYSVIFITIKWSVTYHVITKGDGGFRNDHANVIFALSNADFDYGGGSRNRQKVITLYVNGPYLYTFEYCVMG